MTDQADFTKPPIRRGPKQLLAPALARGRERDASHERRAVSTIEAITVNRAIIPYRGDRHRHAIEISLPRVRFLEKPLK
jgi:hypothetical protein